MNLAKKIYRQYIENKIDISLDNNRRSCQEIKAYLYLCSLGSLTFEARHSCGAYSDFKIEDSTSYGIIGRTTYLRIHR